MTYGNGGTGRETDSGGPKRTPMILFEMERQAKAVESLHDIVSELSGRLSGVTRPDAPTPAIGADSKAGPSPVPLAGGLSDHTGRIDSAGRRLRDLLERLEL